jgi:sugar phosphate isomerase/epimerase
VRFGVSNLVIPLLTEPARREVLAHSTVCDFAPTALYGAWANVPHSIPRRPYGENGPAVCALQSLFFGISDVSLVRDDQFFEKLRSHFQFVAALAARSEIPILIFGSPGTRAQIDPTLPRAGLESRVARLASDAAACRVVVCFEVNAPRFGCEFITTNAELFALHAAIPRAGIGLHLDVGQILDEGLDPLRLLEQCRRDLLHIHLSAPDFSCRPDLMPLYLDVIRGLKADGVSRDVVLEVQKLGAATETDLVTMCEELAAEVAA